MKRKITAIILMVVLVLALALPMAAVGASNGSIVGLWHFDEGSGASTVADSSGNGNTGTVIGATTGVAGMFDQALSFDGDGDYVEVADDDSLDITTAITIEAWINPTTLGGWKYIVSKRSGTVANYGFRLNGQTVEFYYRGSTGWQVWESTSNVVSTGSWQHVAVSFTFGSGSSVALYVDGVPVSGSWTYGNGTESATADTNPVRIGALYPGYLLEFDGLIDEVRIWDVALSEDDIWDSYSLRDVEITKKLTEVAWDSITIQGDEDGIPGVPIVPIETEVTFTMVVDVDNGSLLTMDDVVVKDNLGGDLMLVSTDDGDSDLFDGWGELSSDAEKKNNAVTEPPVTVWWSGKTKKAHLSWNVEELGLGDDATLTLVVQTDINPGQKPKDTEVLEYTSEGLHDLNSGATLKFSVTIANVNIYLVLTTDELKVEAVSQSQQPELGSTGGAAAEWDNGDLHLTSGDENAGDEARIKIWLPTGTTLGDIDSISWGVTTMTGYPPHVDIYLDVNSNAVIDPEDVLTAEFAYNNVSAPAWSPTYNTWLETFETTSGMGVPFDSVNTATTLWVAKLGAGILDAPSGTLADWQAGLLTNNPGPDPLVAGVIDGSAPVLYIEIEVDNWIAESEAYVKDIVITLS